MGLSRGQRWLARLVLLGVGLAAGVVLGEFLGRAISPGGGAELLLQAQVAPPGLYRGHDELMTEPTPGFSATSTSLAGDVEIRFNDQGLRGPTLLPDPNAKRWLVVGDSFTASLQVPEAATFQQLLAERVGIEMWNAGVDGYSTWQATRRYELLDPAVNSSGVLLLFFLGNDIYDNSWYPDQVRNWRAENFRGRPQEDALTQWLTTHSFLYAQLRVTRNRRSLAGDGARMGRWKEELSMFHRKGGGQLNQRMAYTKQALQELKNLTASRGDDLLVALAQPAFAVEDDRLEGTLSMVQLDPEQADVQAPRRAVLQVLEELDIDTCDLTEDLEASAARGEGPYLVFDGHWSEAGHQVVAQRLESCMGQLTP